MATYENIEVKENWVETPAYLNDLKQYPSFETDYRVLDISAGQWFLNGRMRHMYKATFFEPQHKNFHPPSELWRAFCGHSMGAAHEKISNLNAYELERRSPEYKLKYAYSHDWNSATCKNCYKRAIKDDYPVFDLSSLIVGQVVTVNGENFMVNENFKVTATGNKVT